MGDVNIENFLGAENLDIGQATAGAASGEIVAARATRRKVILKNVHASESCWVGIGTVTSSTGYLLKANDSVTIEATSVINGIRNASTDVPVSYIDVYD